jgi:hypothetical protein
MRRLARKPDIHVSRRAPPGCPGKWPPRNTVSGSTDALPLPKPVQGNISRYQHPRTGVPGRPHLTPRFPSSSWSSCHLFRGPRLNDPESGWRSPETNVGRAARATFGIVGAAPPPCLEPGLYQLSAGRTSRAYGAGLAGTNHVSKSAPLAVHTPRPAPRPLRGQPGKRGLGTPRVGDRPMRWTHWNPESVRARRTGGWREWRLGRNGGGARSVEVRSAQPTFASSSPVMSMAPCAANFSLMSL